LIIAALVSRYQTNVIPALRSAQARWSDLHIVHYTLAVRYEWLHAGVCSYTVKVLDEQIVNLQTGLQSSTFCGGEVLTIHQMFEHIERILLEQPCFPGTYCCLTPLRNAVYDAEFSYPRLLEFEGGLNGGDIGAECPLDAIPPLTITIEQMTPLG
jgi:hypothetical protein